MLEKSTTKRKQKQKSNTDKKKVMEKIQRIAQTYVN